jgi:hypothetical protein
MALHIDTFDNVRGGNILYKALTHPRAARWKRPCRPKTECACCRTIRRATDAFNDLQPR